MAATPQSSMDLLQQLKDDPGNVELLSRIAQRTADPAHEVAIRNGMLKLFGVAPDVDSSWSNCIGRQTCYPKSIQYPKSLQDLISTVQAAASQTLTVRAVGSGHSFSDVCDTTGILLDPHGMCAVLAVDTSVLKDPTMKLFSVESGITIAALNKALDAVGLALENMGAYDGQTLAGAISTGTHGTGIALGPIASSVASLTLVTSKGQVLQIEPSDGITDLAKFSTEGVELKQDDALFYTTLISMGCTGLVYSYTLYVVPAFYLSELRTISTWEALKAGLINGASSQVLTSHRGYEIDINPYSIDDVHACIQVVHDNTNATSASGTRGWQNWLDGLLASCPAIEHLIVAYFNIWQSQIPSKITTALDSLKTPGGIPYINKSFDVMNIGTVVNKVKAYALELSMPCDETLVGNVDKLLEFLQTRADTQKSYLSGPVCLRFVAASGAFLAPQAGRPTCMVELDMLVGIWEADALYQAVKSEMCTKGSGIRVHWGLDPEDSITQDDVRDWYPAFTEWQGVYKTLNADKMWNAPLTDRLGISM